MIYKTYENIETGEAHTEFLKYIDHLEYQKLHPELREVFGAINVADPVNIGVTRPPTEFLKNVIGKVKEVNPNTTALEKRWHINREW